MNMRPTRFSPCSTRRPTDDPAADLRAVGFSSVIVTLGSRGSLVDDGSGAVHIPAAVDAVDTTGAGDAYVGTVAARLLAGDSPVDAARMATRVAAFAVSHRGAQDSYPDITDHLPNASTLG